MLMQDYVTLTLTSGHIGKETLAENRDRLRSYTYSPDMDSDCFIHLLMTGSFFSHPPVRLPLRR